MREPTVASVMTSPVITVTPETPVKELVETLSRNGISAVPVVGPEGGLIGVVSEADVLPKPEFHGGADPLPRGMPKRRVRWYRALGLCAAELMTTPVVTIGSHESVALAARRLAEADVRRLFVVDADNQLVGVVSRRDVLSAFLCSDEELRAELEDHVLLGELGTLRVAVKDGVATVDGQVDRRADIELVCQLVRAVPGVIGVRSNLSHRTDDVDSSEVRRM
jgi:CBS domain-containing protein